MPARPARAGLAALLLAGCGSGGPTGPEPPLPVDCTQATIVSLAPGQHLVVDTRLSGSCLHFPAPGPAEAEFAVVAISGAGVVTVSGVSEDYLLQGDPPSAAAVRAAPLPAAAFAFRAPGDAGAFHAR
ncbi:MAG TPA: hypothetical protein VJ773_09170, partial [Gemmatimonadales bacterium]|nr:hypothetical protein [Gemmatimonadales bacterium]